MNRQLIVLLAVVFTLGSSFQILDQCDRRWGLFEVCKECYDTTICANAKLGSFYTILASIFANAKRPCGQTSGACTPDVLAKTLEQKNFRKTAKSVETKDYNFEALASLGLQLIGCSQDRKVMVRSVLAGNEVLASTSYMENYWVRIDEAQEKEAKISSPRNIYSTGHKWTKLYTHCAFKWAN